MKVTILGAGHMGTAMGLRLLEEGHDLTAWNRTPEKLQPLTEAGAHVAEDVATAVAESPVVITMLTAGDAVREVAEQMLPAMAADAIWVQSSTVGAAWADRLRDLAEQHGRTMLDAPVSGSTAPARAGKLTWLVSGPDEACERARPVLDSLGPRVLHVGGEQQASRLKLIVNAWMTAATVAMADALTAADALGVRREDFLDVLTDGPLGMPYAQQKAQLMVDGDYEPGFPVELALKDLHLLHEAHEGRPLLEVLEGRLGEAADAGHGREDLAAVATVER